VDLKEVNVLIINEISIVLHLGLNRVNAILKVARANKRPSEDCRLLSRETSISYPLFCLLSSALGTQPNATQISTTPLNTHAKAVTSSISTPISGRFQAVPGKKPSSCTANSKRFTVKRTTASSEFLTRSERVGNSNLATKTFSCIATLTPKTPLS